MVEAVQSQTAPVIPTQEKTSPSLQELYHSAKDLTKEVQNRLRDFAQLAQAKVSSLPEEFSQAFKEAHQGLGEGILSLKKEVCRVLLGLNEIGKAAMPSGGLIGGPSTVHPNAFKGQIASLQKRLAEMKAETQEEEEAQAELQNLLDQLVPAYEAYLGAGIEYPSSADGTLRYVDASGNTLSEEEFEGIKTRYQDVLKQTTETFVREATTRIDHVFENAFNQVQNALEGISL